MSKNVVVLLAAYNGERYIQEQISSIIEGSYFCDISILVGMEPSTDSTESILRLSSSDKVEVFLNPQPSGGAKQNFTKLVDRAVSISSDYYAFSDQDDVWDKNKLGRSLDMLSELEGEYGTKTPLLVFSDSRLVKYDLSLIEASFIKSARLEPDSADDLIRLIIQNVGQGCTFVFNRALLECAAPVHKNAKMHDHWFMLVASEFGKIGYIPEALLSYRQHESNVLGGSRFNLFVALKRFFNNAKNIKESISASQLQSAAFAERFSELLSNDKLDFLHGFSSLANKGWFYRKLFCLRYRLRMGDFIRTIGFYFFV